MARHKMRHVECTLEEAVKSGLDELTALAEEIREVVDNAEGGRAETQRIQTLGETANTLEQISEPTIDGEIAQIKVTYAESIPSGRRGLSRRTRCDNAISALDAAIEELAMRVDEWDEQHKETKEDNPYKILVEELEDIKGNAEECEFPGMFG